MMTSIVSDVPSALDDSYVTETLQTPEFSSEVGFELAHTG